MEFVEIVISEQKKKCNWIRWNRELNTSWTSWLIKSFYIGKLIQYWIHTRKCSQLQEQFQVKLHFWHFHTYQVISSTHPFGMVSNYVLVHTKEKNKRNALQIKFIYKHVHIVSHRCWIFSIRPLHVTDRSRFAAIVPTEQQKKKNKSSNHWLELLVSEQF